MQALADSLQGVDVPVLVKNPVNPDLELWIGALQRINQAGIKKLGAIHRGFSSFDKKIYRNLPMCRFLLSYTAAYHSCQSSATLATSAADATSSPLSASRQWT